MVRDGMGGATVGMGGDADEGPGGESLMAW